ncbi:hypothetical protein [Aestuariicoccus sp. MJ-SS9]|uniref:hypothetical protein n=1 Tax=Aestuariicoccus sp. MJ-SS9 TaxID=3079855 RepID=UPI0029103402|nr:hypothetical protein [Aestuariicoccus sp. MJ-SS9]MDU8912133.1 hypothetical protein [Aestuariicoccus sp. MJ-SS9]
MQMDRITDFYEKTGRLFQGGFLILRKDEVTGSGGRFLSLIHQRFEKVHVGDFVALIAPGTTWFTLQSDDVTFLVIGDVFDNDGDAVEDRLRALTKGDLIANLGNTDLGGRHAIVAITEGDLLVANDPFGSRSVHYCTGTRVAVASHAALLAHQFGMPRDKATTAFVNAPQYLDRIVCYLPGHRTVYRNIRRLPPNHVYSARFGGIARFWPHKPCEETTREQLFDRFDAALNALRTFVVARYTPVISITGGVDTRSVLTAFHNTGTPFTGVTWRDLNYTRQEAEVVSTIAEKTGCAHLYISQTRTDGDLLDICAAYNAGDIFRAAPRGVLMDKVRAEIANRPDAKEVLPPAFLIGYGGEIVRGFYRKGKRGPEHGFNVQTMIDLYGVASRKHGTDKAYSAYAAAAFREFYQAARFDPRSLKGFDPNDVFYWEHRMAMWATPTMETIDLAMPCLVGLNSRKLYETAIGLPVEQRMSKEIILSYIRSRSPELGAIQVI